MDAEAVLAPVRDLSLDVDVDIVRRDADSVELEIAVPPVGLGKALHALLRVVARR